MTRRFEIVLRTDENPYPLRLNMTWPAAITLWGFALMGAWFLILVIILAVHDAVT